MTGESSYRVVKKNVFEEVAFQQRPKWSGGANHAKNRLPYRGNNKYKGLRLEEGPLTFQEYQGGQYV